MATGIYGTVRPADMSPEDVDINVFYAPNRGAQNSRTFKLDSGNLIPINNPNNTSQHTINWTIIKWNIIKL